LDQIAQDDEGFEINSVRDSLESDVEVGAAPGRHAQHTPPGSGPSSTGTAEGIATAARSASATTGAATAARQHDHRAVSPLPAPKPTRPASVPRASLDGETIFAVGEDEGKWSDDESEAEEREGLVGKRS
jgi:hypothetical protein